MANKEDIEREAELAAYEAEMIKLRGTRRGRKWAKSLALTIPFLLIILGFAVVAVVYVSNSWRAADQSDTMAAQAQLKLVSAAADTYAADHGHSYANMSSEQMKTIDPNLVWVNGSPGPGQVGIIETGETTYRFIYKDTTGTEFVVARGEEGIVTMTTAAGNPL